MPYQKLVTVYSPQERKMLHAQGIWVDKDGNQLRVREMNKYRLEKLVRTLGRWAVKEEDSLSYLSNLPIFVHILLRIREVGLSTYFSFMFETAYELNSLHEESKLWQR